MPRSDSWSAEWSCEKLIAHSDILEVVPDGENRIRILVKEVPTPIFVSTMSTHRVELAHVPDSFNDPRTEFLLNIPKDAFLSGDLLQAAARVPVGIGGIGDLYTAAGEKEFRLYIPKEARFILRGLAQHSAVQHVERINNRTYRISKHHGDAVLVLALNEYDLTADAIRSGIEKYGRPHFVLASNPNCRLTSDSKAVAKSVGTGLLTWRQLLGALNNEP